MRLPVSPDVSLPRRCCHCQFFWNVGRKCRRQATGLPAICDCCESTYGNQCTSKSPKYINCNGLHPTSSKTCNQYLSEKKVLALKLFEKLTLSKASDHVLTCCIRPCITFASILTMRTSLPLTIQFFTGLPNSQPHTKAFLSEISLQQRC